MRILVIEDDRTLRTGLCDALEQEGYEVLAAADGQQGEELLFGRHFDLVVLDVMLPKRGGLELLRRFRAEGQQAPVLLLTARGDESDKVLGLELGADDYVTKPFGVRELLARIKAQLRRQQQMKGNAESGGEPAFRIGDVDVDLGAYQLRRDGAAHGLSPKEAALLALLWREQGKAVGRNRILDEVWGQDQFVGQRTVDTHVLNLRKKLEKDPAKPRHLLTVHGVGYRLVASPEA